MSQEIKVRLSNEGAFPINKELAGIVPLAIESEQETLTRSIKEDGQREPIVLWKGEVVDGRCRMKALTSLGQHIMYKELDSKLTEDEVKTFVKAVNTRRNLTMTQKIMVACRESYKLGSSVSKASQDWGVSTASINNARYITKESQEMADRLFNGESVEIFNKAANKIEVTYKVNVLTKILKSNKEYDMSDKEDITLNLLSAVHTEAGKEFYKDTWNKLYNKQAFDYGRSLMLQALLVETANLKFPLAQDN